MPGTFAQLAPAGGTLPLERQAAHATRERVGAHYTVDDASVEQNQVAFTIADQIEE